MLYVLIKNSTSRIGFGEMLRVCLDRYWIECQEFFENVFRLSILLVKPE